MMGITEIAERIVSLQDEQQRLYEEAQNILALPYGSEEYRAGVARRTEIFDRLTVIRDELNGIADIVRAEERRQAKLYRRPEGWLKSIFSTKLGPLPKNAQTIQPTAENLARVGSYRLVALGMMVSAIVMLVALSLSFPWMMTSPMSLIIAGSRGIFGQTMGQVIGIAVTIVIGGLPFIIPKRKYTEGKFWDKAAMQEEQWFRMGAERWSFGQRAYACLVFGTVHIFNMFYPIASLLVVALMGMVFMMVYLHVFKKTGDYEIATLASTKLHATYNRFAIVYLVLALGISFIFPLLS